MATLRSFSTAVAALVCLVGLPAWVAAGGDDQWDGGESCSLLTASNFDEHLAKQASQGRLCLVMFHVSWCKVCQRAFPFFVAASKKVHERGVAFDFAHVDCTDDKALCSRFMVKGYPSIKLFSAEGEPRAYTLQRNEASFVKYAERMLLPPVNQMASMEELTKALSNETFAAFITSTPAGKPIMPGLEKAAKGWMDRHIFASNPNWDWAALLPAGVRPPTDATLAVVSMGSQQQWSGRDNSSTPKPAVAFYRGSLSKEEAVSEWIKKHRFPGIWALSEANFYEFTHASRRTALLADDPSAVSEKTEAAFRGAASVLSTDFIFGIVDGQSWSDELADFNIYKKDLPRLLVTEDNFETWVEDVNWLRPAKAEFDLSNLVDGAPLLRQNRKTVSKLLFYYREVGRLKYRMARHIERGPLEALMVVTAVMLSIVATFGILFGLYKLFGILLSDPGDFDYVKAAANANKKQQQNKID